MSYTKNRNVKRSIFLLTNQPMVRSNRHCYAIYWLLLESLLEFIELRQEDRGVRNFQTEALRKKRGSSANYSPAECECIDINEIHHSMSKICFWNPSETGNTRFSVTLYYFNCRKTPFSVKKIVGLNKVKKWLKSNAKSVHNGQKPKNLAKAMASANTLPEMV